MNEVNTIYYIIKTGFGIDSKQDCCKIYLYHNLFKDHLESKGVWSFN